MSAPRVNPKGRGSVANCAGDLLCRAARPWGLPRASRRFAHLIPESLRRGHAGLIQRFLKRAGRAPASLRYAVFLMPIVVTPLLAAAPATEQIFKCTDGSGS